MKKNNKGFTIAELLIVVAIIAVLVAIAIPTFGNSLESSRQGATLSNARSAYSEAVTESLATNKAASVDFIVTNTDPKFDKVDTDGLDSLLKGALVNKNISHSGTGSSTTYTLTYTPKKGNTNATCTIAAGSTPTVDLDGTDDEF